MILAHFPILGFGPERRVYHGHGLPLCANDEIGITPHTLSKPVKETSS